VEPLRRDRDFRLLWIGQVVSGLGRQVTSIVLPYQLYVLTGSPLAIGALALVQVVPIMVFALGGGVVADAVDRRRLLLLTQAGLAAASAGLAGLALLPAPPVVAIYAVAFVAAGLGAIDQPARGSAVPRLVPRERLPAAIALGQINFQAAGVVGPAIGGLILATRGIAVCYIFDVVTFTAAIGALLLIAPIPPAHGAVRPSLAAIAAGLRFARRRRVILATFAVDLNAMIFGMPTALFPILALDVFRVGPAGLGLLAAAPAAGALVGAVLTGWVGRVRRTGRAVLWATAAWGLAITAFGLCTFSFPLALVFLAAAGAADVITAVLRSAIVQLITPDELRGRVTSIHILVVTGGPRLGDMEASAVASLAGAQVSVVSGGLLCLVGLAAIIRSFPELAAFDMRQAAGTEARPPEPAPGPTPAS
jgi:MFS family permease